MRQTYPTIGARYRGRIPAGLDIQNENSQDNQGLTANILQSSQPQHVCWLPHLYNTPFLWSSYEIVGKLMEMWWNQKC